MATSNTARDFPLAPLQSMVWPLAILLMVGTAVLPVWYFKRKGWL